MAVDGLEPCADRKPYVVAAIPKPMKVRNDRDRGQQTGRRDSSRVILKQTDWSETTADASDSRADSDGHVACQRSGLPVIRGRQLGKECERGDHLLELVPRCAFWRGTIGPDGVGEVEHSATSIG
jgi:hypothetical protein